jgi:hypothetical protein
MTASIFNLRLWTLALLYFVQGAPYGFQTSCLPLILREVRKGYMANKDELFNSLLVTVPLQGGLSFTALGVMKLLFLPWLCKPLYAPVIERTKTRGDFI